MLFPGCRWIWLAEDKVGRWRVFHGIDHPQMLYISEQISNNGAYMGVRRRVAKNCIWRQVAL